MIDYDLEQDMKNSSVILEKVKDDRYAQNLYAAMCNMQWQKVEVWPVLKEDLWSRTWRTAGGIVAELRGQGDYLDWYCSGIYGGDWGNDMDEIEGYVPESTVTEEIAADLKTLGWIPVPGNEEDLV